MYKCRKQIFKKKNQLWSLAWSFTPMIPALIGAKAGGLSRILGHSGIPGDHVDQSGLQSISKNSRLGDWLSNAEWSALKLHTHKQQNSLSRLYLYIAVYIQC